MEWSFSIWIVTICGVNNHTRVGPAVKCVALPTRLKLWVASREKVLETLRQGGVARGIPEVVSLSMKDVGGDCIYKHGAQPMLQDVSRVTHFIQLSLKSLRAAPKLCRQRDTKHKKDHLLGNTHSLGTYVQ